MRVAVGAAANVRLINSGMNEKAICGRGARNEALSKFMQRRETAAAVSALLPLAGSSPSLERSVSRGSCGSPMRVEQDQASAARDRRFLFIPNMVS